MVYAWQDSHVSLFAFSFTTHLLLLTHSFAVTVFITFFNFFQQFILYRAIFWFFFYFTLCVVVVFNYCEMRCNICFNDYFVTFFAICICKYVCCLLFFNFCDLYLCVGVCCSYCFHFQFTCVYLLFVSCLIFVGHLMTTIIFRA